MVQISSPHPDITQYDEVFTDEEKCKISGCCNSMPFNIGLQSVSEDEMYIHSLINGSDWHSSSNPIKDCFEKTKAFSQLLSDHKLAGVAVNVYTVADCQDTRCYPSNEVIIYFTNIEWKSEFGGDILFYDAHGKSVVCAIPCVPNRMIVFKGDMIHRISTPNQYMLTTFTALFNKQQHT